ncbi:LytR/AlgR family response regulator transcription factor [Saccharicrinis fermentans]|uniref:Putative transcriptional regulatory protein YehT n=1 Tax=Saccharicrinis fermentans DSM 9555 = JCM 21142 TaxID=869213 RepID=W7YHH2_9BACT|nr:LytTR family DNA-binding domain-containing protein [Saccharicrinis fermentans]GAF03901.1 putative transcriptional regulatory protein YehT [Saccharicrinis fermentans DSM 9555 = JCM 21142]
MNCIIIDDDKLSTKIIAEFVEKTDELNLIETYESAVDGINYLNGKHNAQIDILFLDIEMPEMTGIDVLKTLNILPQVIIYSSQEKYALESYEYNVTDYLLKPVTYPRFLKAINKVKEKNEKSEDLTKNSTEIFIKNNSSLVRVKYEDILWIEALENYVVVNTFRDKYTIHFTMKAISDKMPSDKFVRVHRSFIVNLSKIKVIEDNSVVIKTESGSKVIPIGKSYKDQLMNDINLITK